jgi:hypothetical protein
LNSGLGKNGWWGRLAHDFKLIVKPILRKGLLVLPMDSAELDSEALDREIREERERENARLLG